MKASGLMKRGKEMKKLVVLADDQNEPKCPDIKNMEDGYTAGFKAGFDCAVAEMTSYTSGTIWCKIIWQPDIGDGRSKANE